MPRKGSSDAQPCYAKRNMPERYPEPLSRTISGGTGRSPIHLASSKTGASEGPQSTRPPSLQAYSTSPGSVAEGNSTADPVLAPTQTVSSQMLHQPSGLPFREKANNQGQAKLVPSQGAKASELILNSCQRPSLITTSPWDIADSKHRNCQVKAEKETSNPRHDPSTTPYNVPSSLQQGMGRRRSQPTDTSLYSSPLPTIINSSVPATQSIIAPNMPIEENPGYLLHLESLVLPATVLEKNGYILGSLSMSDLERKKKCAGCGKCRYFIYEFGIRITVSAMSKLDFSKSSKPSPRAKQDNQDGVDGGKSHIVGQGKRDGKAEPNMRCRFHNGTVSFKVLPL